MRKVEYGRLVDFMPPEYDPFDLIGAHRYTKHAEQESLKTADYDYYILKEGLYCVIDDATFLEKIVARMQFAFKPNKRKIIGVRALPEQNVKPYSSTTPTLGTKLDEHGKEIVDDAYYDKAVKKAASKKDNEALNDAIEKRKQLEEYLRAAKNTSNDENVESKQKPYRR